MVRVGRWTRTSGGRRFSVPRRVALLCAAAVALTSCITVNDYTTPGGYPWGMTFDAGGRVWVALPGCDPAPTCPASTPPGKLGLFDPSSHTWTTTVSLPSGYGQPLFVAVDGGGRVWFTTPVTNAIGRYDPATNAVTQWTVPTPSSGPWGLVLDRNGIVWFTEHYVDKIASFDPASETFKEIATPPTNSNPYGIAVDAANNIWFTENPDAVALIGEYTNSGVLNEYKIRDGSTAGTGLTPHLITVDASGNVWWSEGFVGAIARLDVRLAQPGTNNGVTEYWYPRTCSSCGTHTSGIDADANGRIWFDDSLQNTFGSFRVSNGTFRVYNSPGGHPHDGLNVDAANRIWFDEEFANRIAEAIP
jgi:streptogramin lyase